MTKPSTASSSIRCSGMVKLNLGCGYRKREGYINIDNRMEVAPDLCVDVTCGLPFEDSSVDEVLAFDFLEHIPIGKTMWVIEEIYRVLKPSGVFDSFTPSTDGRGAFQDPTHVSFWNINSWLYYMDNAHRDLYGIKAKFAGNLRNFITDQNRQIVHVLAELKAVK